jgi:hypothetical protein
VADKLQELVTKAEDLKDDKKIKAYEPLKTVIYRLEARAQ